MRSGPHARGDEPDYRVGQVKGPAKQKPPAFELLTMAYTKLFYSDPNSPVFYEDDPDLWDFIIGVAMSQ